MNNKFSLIQQLNNQEEEVLPSGINYQEYVLEVKNQEQNIFIPLNESEEFENILKQTDTLDKESLRSILRKYRGIRIRNKE